MGGSRTLRFFCFCVVAGCSVGLVGSAIPTPDPATPAALDSGTREDVEVRLVLIDTVVVDADGRTVSDLGIEDFEILVDGDPKSIDTLDLNCPGGSADDVRGVNHAKKRSPPAAPDFARKIVLAFDYQHMSRTDVVDVLSQAKQFVRYTAGVNDEIMLAALIGGLRIEQSFSSDHRQVLHALKRMQYDISLWNADYSHRHEGSFFAGLEALLRIVGAAEGPKALVLYSNNPSSATEEEPSFERVAALASSSRCAIYSVHAAGLIVVPPG